MSWIDIHEAQILGRIGGRYSLFCCHMIAVCLRYLPLSKTFIRKLFFFKLQKQYSIGKWVFRLKSSRFKITSMFFYVNFNYFNYKFRVKYWLLKTNNSKTKHHKANSNNSQSVLRPPKLTATVSLLGIYPTAVFTHNTITCVQRVPCGIFYF